MSQQYTFHTPVRKKDAFVSRVQPAKGATAVVMSFKDCRVLSVKTLGEGGGYLVKLAIATRDSPAFEALRALDAAAFEAVSANNGAWFKNNLTPEMMQDYFRSSAEADKGHFTVLVSGVMPLAAFIDGKEEEADEGRGAMKRLMTTEPRDLKAMLVANAEVEAQGLYFYPKRFGVRWRLRRLECLTEEGQQEAVKSVSRMFALSRDDREAIEADWAREVEEFCGRMDAQIAALEGRKDRARKLLASAVALSHPDREWNSALESLRTTFYLTS